MTIEVLDSWVWNDVYSLYPGFVEYADYMFVSARYLPYHYGTDGTLWICVIQFINVYFMKKKEETLFKN